METRSNTEEFYFLIQSIEKHCITKKKKSNILVTVELGEVLRLVYIHGNALDLLIERPDFCLFYYSKLYCCSLT